MHFKTHNLTHQSFHYIIKINPFQLGRMIPDTCHECDCEKISKI